MNPNDTLKVSEIFYSLQGEGARAGEASLFVRLQGCSAKHACYAGGVKCDTEFESGKEMTLGQICAELLKLSEHCNWIIFTGGEPTDQLTKEHLQYFKLIGYKLAIETSGLNPIPIGLDFVCLSPKVAEHVLLKTMKLRDDGTHVDEIRYVRHTGQSVPETEIKAHHYYLSPHFDGINPNSQNIQHCVTLCKEYPTWKLSLQQHKYWNVL